MIEFVLKNRRLRLYPDGTFRSRALWRGKETKKESWTNISFIKHKITGYMYFSIMIEDKKRYLYEHRIVWLAHHPSWDIFDSSPNNSIDHINHKKDDNRIVNLRNVTHQYNMFNTLAKGYSWDTKYSKWVAYIMLDRKKRHLGYYVNEDEARAAYLKAKEELHIIQ